MGEAGLLSLGAEDRPGVCSQTPRKCFSWTLPTQGPGKPAAASMLSNTPSRRPEWWAESAPPSGRPSTTCTQILNMLKM